MSQPLPITSDFDFIYLSFGAGVQSTALLVCSALGLHRVPRANVAIFADTQNEPPHVYENVARMRAWAAPYGIPVETVTAGNLLADAKARIAGTRSRFVSIPMFTTGKDAVPAPGRRQCTREYKINPIEKRVRELLGYRPRQHIRERVANLVGISADEFGRIKPSRTPWITRCHPLVDALISREGCVRIVLAAGLPRPRKSACVFCPYTDNARWREMKRDDPESFALACHADEALRDQRTSGLRSAAFLHRLMRPLREIDFDTLPPDRPKKAQGMLGDAFMNECEGMCGI